VTIESATKHIRNAVFAAVVSAALTLVLSVLSMTGHGIKGVDSWELFDAAFLAMLAVGVYRRSRVSAVLLAVYFLASKVAMFSEGMLRLWGLPISALFLYFYVQGVRGTIHYHRLMNTPKVALLTIVKRTIGVLLVTLGLVLTVVIIGAQANGDSDDPIWVDAIYWLFFGLLPIVGGVLLLRTGLFHSSGKMRDRPDCR
jgi:serine/threonine-protein kinase